MGVTTNEHPVGARVTALRIALVAVGIVFTLGVAPLVVLWPSGWSWGASPYLAMILTLYATLGVFLVLAARDPMANRSVIWFTVWSSLVHAATMTVQSFSDTAHHGGHLFGDVPALVLVAVVLAVLLRRVDAGSAAATRGPEPAAPSGPRSTSPTTADSRRA